MGEVRNRQDKPGPGIVYSEIYIFDDQNLGKGKYTVALEPNALAKRNPIMSVAVNPPEFQISVNINPATKEIPISLGKADGSPPLSQVTFNLPVDTKLSETYNFVVDFDNWVVQRLTLNESELSMKTQSGTVSFWVEPKKNPGAFTAGKNYIWGNFEVNGEKCIIRSEGDTLLAELNKGSNREIMIFSIRVTTNPNMAHMISVTWSNKEMNLYFDADCLVTLKMSDFFCD